MVFRGLSDEKGQGLVEFALIALLLFLLIFGIFDLSIVIFSYDTIANAAREGARYSIIDSHGDCGCGVVRCEIEDLFCPTTGLDLSRLQCACTRDETTVHVVVSYTAQLITQAVGVPAITLHTTATMRRE